MAIREVREEGDEILRKVSRPVEKIDEKILVLLDDMIETMHKHNGVGLAAVQVGILKRVIVIDLYEEGVEPLKIINPKILKSKGEREVEEGCLSFPNQYAKMIRPKEVTVEYLNEKGETIKLKAKELLAQAFVHELEHLEGKLFVDSIIEGTLKKVDPEENK